MVASVWIGYDTDGYLNGITGGGTPATIWRNFMIKALVDIPSRDFIRPNGVVLSPPPTKAFDDPSHDNKTATPTTADGKNEKKPDSKAKDESRTDKTTPPPPNKGDKTSTMPPAPTPVSPSKAEEAGRKNNP